MLSGFLDLPSLIKIKIISKLDEYSIIQVSQTCQILRQLVGLDHILALELPIAGQYEDQELIRKKVLRLMLNVKGSNLASRLDSLIPCDSGLELDDIVSTLGELKYNEVVEICINVSLESLYLFEPKTQDNYRRLLEMVRRMQKLTVFKLTIRGVPLDMQLMHNLVKICKEFIKCSYARHCILKLPALSNLKSINLDVNTGVWRLDVIGPCFGISTRRSFEFEVNGNTRLKINNGICLFSM